MNAPRPAGFAVDELVEIARAHGMPAAGRRTINGWRGRGDIDKPRRAGSDWIYPESAAAAVVVLARWHGARLPRELIRFALFVHAGTVPPSEAVSIADEYLRVYSEALTEERARLDSPDAVRDEAAAAARMRGRAPLPHRVRGVSLEQRELAMLFLLSKFVSAPIEPAVIEAGQFELERIMGIRGGRGGSQRDVSGLVPASGGWVVDPTALRLSLARLTAKRVELARRSCELLFIWFTALAATWSSIVEPGIAPLIDIMRDWSDRVRPDVYVMLFAILASSALDSMTDEQVDQGLAFRPEDVAAELLAERPENERRAALARLDPYHQGRLESLLAAT